MSLCNDCHNRSLCKTLCPEAELYVNQDTKYTRDTILDAIDIDNINKKAKFDINAVERQRILENFSKWPKKLKIATLLDYGMDRKQIAEVVGITRENLRKTISRIKKEAKKEATVKT